MLKSHNLYLCLASIAVAIEFTSLAQAQTVIGMGTDNPNPNAVLELVPENGNQGFLAPRLTTAQRTASSFTGKLTGADNGLLVFDIDQGQFYHWYKGEWRSGVSSSGGGSTPMGTTWYTGTNAPRGINATEGDFYINERTGEVYKFSNNSFGVIGSLSSSGNGGSNQNLTSVLQQGNSAARQKITDLGKPTNPNDAATKDYVDQRVGDIPINSGTLNLPEYKMFIGDANNKATPITITGDVQLSQNGEVKTVGLQQRPVANTIPRSSQVLTWDGSKWIPMDVPATAGGGSNIPIILTGNGNPNNNNGKVGDIYIKNGNDIYIKVKNNKWIKLEEND